MRSMKAFNKVKIIQIRNILVGNLLDAPNSMQKNACEIWTQAFER